MNYKFSDFINFLKKTFFVHEKIKIKCFILIEILKLLLIPRCLFLVSFISGEKMYLSTEYIFIFLL